MLPAPADRRGEVPLRLALDRLPLWALVLLLAGLYFLAGRFGLSLAFVNASASPVWPPAGIALAALLLLGPGLWPGVFLGAFLVNALTTGPTAVSLAIAAGNTLEALAGAALVGRFAGGPWAFHRAQDVFRFALLGAASCALGATVGATSLSLGGLSSWGGYAQVWLTWWLGDLAGALLVTPFIVLWASPPPRVWTPAKALEAALVLLSLALVGRLTYGGWLPGRMANYPLSFLAIPILVWTAFRFGKRETAAMSLLLSGFAIHGTLRGFGPFALPTPNESLLLLQAYLGVKSLMALALAALASEQKRVERDLRSAHADLERRVAERTAELSKANASLRSEAGARERTALELRRRSGVLTTILDSMAEGVVVADVDGRYLLFNKAAEAILGIGRGAFPAERWPLCLRAYQPDGTTLLPEGSDPLRRALDGEAVDDYEALLRTADAPDGVWVLGGARPFKEAGAVVGGIVVLRDITERKRAEQEVHRAAEDLARSNSELNMFAWLVSHELQEPLRKILSFGGLLKAPTPDPDGEQARCVRRMRESAQHMQSLVQDILSLCRVTTEPSPLERVDLSEVLAEVVSDFSDRLQESGGTVEAERLPAILADAVQMRQLFRNLLSNALKFRRPGEPPRVAVSWRSPSPGFIEITVSDNGIGFEEQYKERIFKPFQRLHRRGAYEGSGIGLSICQRILLRHGGSISARSEPGKGSSFIVTLPAQDLPTPERSGAHGLAERYRTV